ncbi:recombination protein RecR [bacterium]|nr:recombination protein RecR [bacterium]
MDTGSPLLDRLIGRLTRLPGIGERSAQRIALHLLHAPAADSEELAGLLSETRARVGFCGRCGYYAEGPLCRICADPGRRAGVLCVVEQPVEVMSLERAGVYRGRYHVLGGVISPLDGVHPEDLSVEALVERIAREEIRELVLALSGGVEGETTALYLVERLRGLPLRLTRLARGLPVGVSLEYTDEATLQRAFEGRVELS